MRKRESGAFKGYKIAALDDEIGIIDTLSVIFKRSGYHFSGFTVPEEALEALKTEEYDLLILDYLMGSMRGDEFVKRVRKFNNRLYILLLTGHKDLAPPLETIRALDIQGYCEKSSKFDQLILLVESAIKSVSQMREIRKLNEGLNNAYKELEDRYIEIVETLRLSVDCKDIFTRGHSDRVSYYAVKIGKALKLSKSEIEILKVSGIFHDLGKIGVADEILFKKGRLTDQEYEEIKKHPVKGAHILSASTMFKDALPVIKHHHERIDGKGYPAGLAGDEIPLLTRILSIADAFDAMISDRHYRKRLDVESAKEQLLKGSGTQFDGEIVDVFLELIKDYKAMEDEMERLNLNK